jgi:iron complex transport system substrate-binding protein
VRIVSVLPSATEIVCALGAREELVARSAECDYPPDVADLPVVMRARTPDDGRSSGEIDARVNAVRGRGESLYELDVGVLRAARPDLLLTQDLCGVCSITGDEVTQGCRAAGVRPRILSLSPRTLDEVWTTFEVVGSAIGRAGAGQRLASSARRSCTHHPTSSAPRVAVVEWLDPPILAGLWAPEMVRVAGGTPLGPAAGEPGGRTTWRELAALRPDVLLLSPCSFSVERTLLELADPSIARRIAETAPGQGTFVADESFFSRPGPRLVDGVDLVRTIVDGAEPRSSGSVVRWRPRLAGVDA